MESGRLWTMGKRLGLVEPLPSSSVGRQRWVSETQWPPCRMVGLFEGRHLLERDRYLAVLKVILKVWAQVVICLRGVDEEVLRRVLVWGIA